MYPECCKQLTLGKGCFPHPLESQAYWTALQTLVLKGKHIPPIPTAANDALWWQDLFGDKSTLKSPCRNNLVGLGFLSWMPSPWNEWEVSHTWERYFFLGVREGEVFCTVNPGILVIYWMFHGLCRVKE